MIVKDCGKKREKYRGKLDKNENTRGKKE